MKSNTLPLLLATGIVIAVIIAVRPGGGRTAAPARPDSRDAPSAAVDSAGRSSVVQSAGSTTSESPRAEFMYLFDVSTSTHTGGAMDPFLTATQILGPAVDALRSEKVEHIFLPSRHRVGTVGAASLMQQPLCDFRVEPMMVFRTTDTSATAKRVGTCVSRLREVKPENATDIRGALHFASLSLRGDRSMTRGIVLITDLEEFIPKNRVAAEPDLRGICVNVYTVMTPASAARPDSLALREKDWNARIMKWGAKRVRVQSVLGFDAEDLAGFFRSCAS